MLTSSRFRLNDSEVIFEHFNTEVVAIQLATGAYYSITGAGLDAFLLLPFEPTTAEMAEAMAEKYGANAVRIRQDLDIFFEQLQNERLVIARPAEAGQRERCTLPHEGSPFPYAAPAIQPFHDLQELFLLDPIHDVAQAGWPQAKPSDAQECRYRPKIGDSVIFERFDDETVAMNLERGTYHSLMGPSEDIFLLLVHEPTKAEIVSALGTKYVAADHTLSEGTATFVDSLVRAGLAEQEPLEASAEETLAVRQLALTKPGQNVPFVSPSLDTFRDHAAPAALLDGPQIRSELRYARKRFRIAEPEVIFRPAGSLLLVISLSRGDCFVLNSSAAVLWRLLQQQPTSSELVDAVSQLYGIDRRELVAAVLVLLHNLIREGLITAEEAGDGLASLDTRDIDAPGEYEAFSVQAHRKLPDVYLPFQVTKSRLQSSPGNGRELVSLLSGYQAEAEKRTGITEAVFGVAGHKIRIRCAGALRGPELGLAFTHLSLPPGTQPDLTIQVWDCVSGGPPPASSLELFLASLHDHWVEACGPRGEVHGFHSPELAILYHPGPDILSVIDAERGVAYYLKRDLSPLPYWEIGSPFRAILHTWLSTRGLQFVHAGAVGMEDRGVLLAGKGGSGKSTTSLACLSAGMSYAGDDYCAVDVASTPFVHSLYNTAKLKGPADINRFPHLKDRIWNANGLSKNGDKAQIFLSKWWPDQMSHGFPLRAILIPKVSGERDTRLGDCSEAEALLAILPSTVALLPMAGSMDVQRLGELVGKLPRYTIHLGTDIDQIPGVIQSLF